MINNGTQAQGDGGGDASIWTQPRFVASATVVAIIVVLGIVLAVTGRGGDGTAATPAADTPPVAVAPVKGDCDLPAGDQTVPESTPGDTRWELVGKMIAPTAPSTYGPGVVKDGFRTCFAQSPLGALYAAASFWATLTAKTDAETYKRLAVDSPARERAIAAAKDQQKPELQGLQVAGFTFSSYARDRTTVKMAFRLEDGGLVAADTTLLWRGNDWRYEIPLDQGRASISRIADLGGFVQWKGA